MDMMNTVQEYQTTHSAPQSALQSLLRPTRAQEARMGAFELVRSRQVAGLHHAAELRHETRVRLARQHLINGDVDLTGYRTEIAAAGEALDNEKRDVPPSGGREVLIEHGYAVAVEAFVSDIDRALDVREKQAAAWTPAAVEQAAGCGVGDE